MKHPFTFLAFLATTSLIATAGCSDRARDPDPTVSSTGTSPAAVTTAAPVAPTPAPAPTATPVSVDPFAEISTVLAKTTRDQTAGLAGPQQNMDRAINAQIDAWKATGVTSTNKSEEQLALARTDFSQKLSALSVADDTTWKNAKGEALASLQSLQQAYHELLAGPVKN